MALCSLGFPGPPGTASHALTQSLQSSDSGRSAGRHGILAATAPSVVAGPLRQFQRLATGAVPEELTQCRGGMDPTRQDSRRRGPTSSLQCLRQPGAWAASAPAFNLCFSTQRTGELVHPVRGSTACPGTGTGHGTASTACHPTLHQRALNNQLHEPSGESSTGVGGGRRTADLPCFLRPHIQAIVLGPPGGSGISFTRLSREEVVALMLP